MCVMELMERMELQTGLQDFKWFLDFKCYVINFLVWIDHHFGKNAPNALSISICLNLFRCAGDN